MSEQATRIEVRRKLTPPRGECQVRAKDILSDDGSLLSARLPTTLREQTEKLLDSLPSVAQSVLVRTRGVWFARGVKNASGIYLTCDVAPDRSSGGFVLLDVDDFAFDQPIRDKEVPGLYWRALAGDLLAAFGPLDPLLREPESIRLSFQDHARRYILLHELGHALSLFAGEFGLDDAQRLEVDDFSGFAGYSWKLVSTDRKFLSTTRAIIPDHGIEPMVWGNLLDVVGADADRFVPGYALVRPKFSKVSKERILCEMPSKLVRAGFVTPAAARFATEDYAEMFAHAILASEGKIRRQSRIRIGLPGCGTQELSSPYFAGSVAAKRAYIEHVIGIGR